MGCYSKENRREVPGGGHQNREDDIMRRRNGSTRSQRGMAALEMAIILPVLAALFFVLVEGSNAIRTYSLMTEVSREAARLVLREGNADNVSTLVQSLTQGQLSSQNLTTNVTTNTQAKTVTVEVQYGYTSLMGSDSMLQSFNNDQPYVLLARTTMPLP